MSIILRAIVAVLALCLFIGWGTTCVVRNIMFDVQCGGHIKRAADANTIALAKQEMVVVVKYLEENGMTHGYTSILWRAPDEDVGFWYQNLKSALDELESVKSDATQLEKSNLLLKLRETLLDHGQHGEHLTVPPGITVFPGNVAYCAWAWGSIILFLLAAGSTTIKLLEA